MTTLTIQLPDALAQQAQQAGLLNESVLPKIFEDAVRRYGSGRMKSVLEKAAVNPEPAPSMQELSKIRQSLRQTNKS
jgi:hypothetical protein